MVKRQMPKAAELLAPGRRGKKPWLRCGPSRANPRNMNCADVAGWPAEELKRGGARAITFARRRTALLPMSKIVPLADVTHRRRGQSLFTTFNPPGPYGRPSSGVTTR